MERIYLADEVTLTLDNSSNVFSVKDSVLDGLLPQHTSEDAGKALTVQENNTLDWEDAGKVNDVIFDGESVLNEDTKEAVIPFKEVTTEEYEQEKETNPDYDKTYYAINDDQPNIIAIMQEMFWPVGSIVIGDNLTDEDKVKAVYGGTKWVQVYGSLYGSGEQTALGEVSEQMPMMTFTGTAASHTHTFTGTAHGHSASSGNAGGHSHNLSPRRVSGAPANAKITMMTEWTGKEEQYYTTRSGCNRYASADFCENFTTNTMGDHSHSITVNNSTAGGSNSNTSITPSGTIKANGDTGVMVDNGHVLTKGYSSYAWRRTA